MPSSSAVPTIGPAVGPTVGPTKAGFLQPRLRCRFEDLIPKRSIRVDRGYPDLTCRRSVLASYPRDSKLLFLVQAGERNFVARPKHSVDALQQRSPPADIHRH